MVRIRDVLLLGTLLAAVSETKSLPKYITKCHRSNPQLGTCIKNEMEKLRPRLLKGIPELKIPPYDPMQIPELRLEQGTEAVKFKAHFANVTVYGARHVRVDEIKVDLKNLRVEIFLFFPKLRIKTKYNIAGKVLVLPVVGKGSSDGNFTSVSANATLSGKYVDRNGVKYIKLTDRDVDLRIGGSNLFFDDLFNGNRDLIISTNKFFNQNWRDIIKELNPVIEETIASLVSQLVRNVLEEFPLDEILPP